MKYLRFIIMIYIFLFAYCSYINADEYPVLKTLAKDIEQAVIVKAVKPGSFSAQLSGWERDNGKWKKVTADIAAVVGENGVAPFGDKREGDGRTPAGIFLLGTAFGYHDEVKTGLAYRKATGDDYWVDDPMSIQYNKWIVGEVRADSYERMKRDDDLYEYGIVVEYNMKPVVVGKGSAIFMHVWRDKEQPTSGCVALAKDDILTLLNWLDESRKPVIIMGDSDEKVSN